MPALTLSLLQTATHWHDAAANRAHFERLFSELPDDGQLVVLPEMFSTGFTMASTTQAEPVDGPTTEWLRVMAARWQRAFCGSLIVVEDGQFYNRFLLVTADGAVQHYDKRHRFRMAGEHEHFAAGKTRRIFQLDGFRICPQVCYDLRFPVFSRNLEDYDVLLYVANWPAPRALAWNTLLRARAIENLAYTVGLNRIGTDGNDVGYQGDSAIYGPDGAGLLQLADAATVATTTLSLETLEAYRERFPAWRDRDAFELDFGAAEPAGS